MQKVILFGASLGGESFLQHQTNLDVIAFSDNDSSRWGHTLLGKPIVNPAQLAQLDFDQIIITSQWIDSIKHQLIHELGIDAKKIQVPAKSSIKPPSLPFQHPTTLAFAQQTLIQLTSFLDQHSIQAIADSGTALGLVRDGDLIPWDDDLDLAIDSESFTQLKQLVPNLIVSLPQNENGQWQATLIKLANEDACINLDLISHNQEQLKDLEISLQKRQTVNDRSELVSSAGIFDAPATHFIKPIKTSYLNGYVYLPNKVQDFLTFMYGSWQTPKQNTNFENYDNRQKQANIDLRSTQITKQKLI